MATIITRAGKASALSANEYDENLKMETRLEAAGTAIAADDNRATVVHTGTGDTFTLPDLSTLLAAEDTGDFIVTIKHGGTSGSLTIDPAAANTIDGTEQNLTLAVAEVVTLKGSTSDNWLIVNRSLPDGTEGYIMRMGAINPAWQASVYGALLYKTSDTSGLVTATWTDVSFDTATTELYDTASCHTVGQDYIVVPSGMSYMRIVGCVSFAGNATGDRFAQIVTSAGVDLTPKCIVSTVAVSAGINHRLMIDTGWRTVSAAAEYKMQAYQNSGGNRALQANETWMAVEFK